MTNQMLPVRKLFHIEKGELQSTKCTKGEFDFITAAEDWKKHNEYSHECEALIFAAAASGSLGRTHYIDGKFTASDLCYILTQKNEDKYPLNLSFYHFVFNSLRSKLVASTKSGTSKESINQTNLKNYEIPYFDIEQQDAWIEKLKKTLALKNLLSAELIHQQNLLQRLRQQILQEAIEGKITAEWRAQNPDLEPANNLLKRIAAEKEKLIEDRKIKAQKPLPPISDNKKPFAIPESWEWCNYGDVMLKIEAGASPLCFNYPASNDEWGVLKISAISWDAFQENENKKLHPNIEPFTEKEVKFGDFIMTRANTKELVAKSVIVGTVRDKLLLNDKTLRVRFSEHIDNKFINYFNNSEYSRRHYIRVSTGASPSMKNISRDNIKTLLLPLPPVEEQKVIVSRVEKLLNICDQLETKITQNQGYAEQLMQEVLKEAFSYNNTETTLQETDHP
ncbi:restriction endonuclease subunit S [Legionella spiritensis]|uniref:restriction endonuclease subunit S n=1 Tax=Legionella spiritensis TaxID=452 RepID=UPI000F712DC7|nr:restriction endonuclease subunit S [Legionella spiritensis]VEG91164.1 Type I restriction enzyme EcoKI specificity protein [Legionella spiritensis]